MDKNRLARPVAVGVVRRGEELLVSEGYDGVKQEPYWRLLGGTIEFGELGADAVTREFQEELGIEMRVLRYLGTLENLFTWEGAPGHELVRVYQLEPTDRTLYELDAWTVIGSGWGQHAATWKRPEDMGDRLYPHGIRALIEDQRT